MTLSRCPRHNQYPKTTQTHREIRLECPSGGCEVQSWWWSCTSVYELLRDWGSACREAAWKMKEEAMKGKEDNRCCAMCGHFQPIDKLEGHCRGVPPQFVGYDPRLNEPMFKFPIVAEALCCGQFKERVEAYEEEK